MAVYSQAHFENETLILDGNEFDHCELKKCTLVYKGHEHVKLEHCQIAKCTWQFEDAALRTVIMLKGLYLSGQKGKEIVDSIFKAVGT